MECDSSGDCPICSPLTPCRQYARHIKAHAYLPGMLPPNRTAHSIHVLQQLIKGVRESQ